MKYPNCERKNCEEHLHCPICNSPRVKSEVFDDELYCLDCKEWRDERN